MTKRVMIVDDNPSFLDFASSCLRAAGYEPVLHGQGRGAVAEAASLKPDLVLLDISMSDINGFSVLKSLRCNAETRAIPVIVCTGAVGFVRQQETMLDHLNVGVIEKPFNLNEFLAKVEKAIGKQ